MYSSWSIYLPLALQHSDTRVGAVLSRGGSSGLVVEGSASLIAMISDIDMLCFREPTHAARLLSYYLARKRVVRQYCAIRRVSHNLITNHAFMISDNLTLTGRRKKEIAFLTFLMSYTELCMYCFVVYFCFLSFSPDERAGCSRTAFD